MRRRLFNIASAVSLLLCVGTLVAWGMGYFSWKYRTQSFPVYRSDRINISSLDGQLFVFYTHKRAGDEVEWTGDFMGFGRHFSEAGSDDRSLQVNQYRTTFVYAPFGAIALMFCLLPLLTARWIYIRRRRGNLLEFNPCSVCSYNLTGNTSGVCPECGTTIVPRERTTLSFD